MTNPTMKKFGYPTTLIRDYAYWVVLLRDDQVTLGSLVVAEKSPATSLSAVAPNALAELASIAGDIETAFARTFKPDKFNYLMLMMVDPNVHFHVLPRYSSSRKCAGVAFEDRAWPKAPSLGEVTPTTLLSATSFSACCMTPGRSDAVCRRCPPKRHQDVGGPPSTFAQR